MATAKSKIKAEVTVSISVNFTLDEAKALCQLTTYGTKHFLRVFYANMGRAYLQPHERGLISLFETIKDTLPNAINECDMSIKNVNDLNK